MSDLDQAPARVLRQARRRGSLAAILSVVGHVLALVALLSMKTEPAMSFQPQLMVVTLVEERPPAEPTPKPKAEPSPSKPPQRRNIFRPTPKPPPPDVEPMPAGEAETPAPGVEVSDSELAGAATAGSGPGGGACNMPKLLQNALRKNRLVRAAVANVHRGKAISIWNGDWVRHGEQEGAGLAAVRESIMWEVGFAPAECRSQPVRGLVVISLDDGPGAARIVLGQGQWRWSQLLYSGSAGSNHAKASE